MNFFNNHRGTSLFELLCVLILTTVVAVLIFARFSAKHYDLIQEATKIAVAFEYGRQFAVATGKQELFMFDVEKNRYTIGALQEALPHGIRFGASPGVFGPPSSPKNSIDRPVSYPNQVCLCSPDGTLSSGCVYITDGLKTVAITTPVGSSVDVRMYITSDTRWHLYE